MEKKTLTIQNGGERLDKTIINIDDSLSSMAVQRLIQEKKNTCEWKMCQIVIHSKGK